MTKRDNPKMVKTIWSNELLIECLHLPEDTRIVSVNPDPSDPRNTIIFLEHPSIPSLVDGEEIPISKPEFVSHFDGCGNLIKIEMVGWGVRTF